MSVKIIIERRFKAPLAQENLQVIEAIRVPAMRQKGYISGETIVNAEDPREVVVVSTWLDFDGFNSWANSQERTELENQLAPHLEGPTKVSSFMLGPDAIDQMFETIVHDSEVES